MSLPRGLFLATTLLVTRASIRGWRDSMKDPSAANALIEKLDPALNPDWVNYSYQARLDVEGYCGECGENSVLQTLSGPSSLSLE